MSRWKAMTLDQRKVHRERSADWARTKRERDIATGVLVGSRTCGTCGELGHYPKTCPFAEEGDSK